jgi:nicotinamide riboside kinase
MVISFTGAQSTGKSTLLEKMRTEERFRKFNFVPEITRGLKSKYKLDINESGDEFTQLITVNSHLYNYLDFKGKDVVLDRCILDGLIYTMYQYQTKKIPIEVYNYSEYLFKKLIGELDVILYTEPDIPLVDDGERSANKEFRDIIINLFEEAIDHYKINVVRLKGSVDKRMETIYNTFDNYGK